MPRRKTTDPEPTRNKGQRSIEPLYLTRFATPWANPTKLFSGDVWRTIVQRQPIAVICRDTLISYVNSLDFAVMPRDASKRDEYKDDIDYYENLFTDDGNYDYVDRNTWILEDALDTPFGGAAEVGRVGDSSTGKVMWIEPLDSATLFPTLNEDYPVGQILGANKVYFPKHAINRMGIAPQRQFIYRGWYMPPPAKIYLAMEMLNRGDYYYAALLLDTPQVGILDLMDMAKEDAELWVKSWRDLLSGIDPFKIPVLYEHEREAKFIPFQRSPIELMFDKALMKYVVITTAGYGTTPSDIGLQSVSSGGETLAGSIRGERKTRKSGFATLKNKLKLWYDRLLPPYLQFKFIDLDDELNVALGRSRLATATAFNILIDAGMFTTNELRKQFVADGLVNVPLPEEIEGGDDVISPETGNTSPSDERPSLLGKPIAPSQGGYGEQRSDVLSDYFIHRANLGDETLIDLSSDLQSPLWDLPELEDVLASYADIVSQEKLIETFTEFYDVEWPEMCKNTYESLSLLDKDDNLGYNIRSELNRLYEDSLQKLSDKLIGE